MLWLTALFSAWVCVIALLRLESGPAPWSAQVAATWGWIVLGVVVGTTLMRWGRPALSITACAAACLVGLAVSADPIVPASLLQLVMVAVVVQLRPPMSLYGVAASAAAYLLLAPLGPSSQGLLRPVDDVLIEAALAVAVGAVTVQLARHTQRLDHLGRELLSAEVEASMSRAEADAASGLRAALHDHVAYALTLVAGGDTPELARTACRDAAEALGRVQVEVEPSPATVGDVLDRAREASPVELEMVSDEDVGLESLEPAMAQAVLRGVLEALRNVRRHTGETSATLACARSEGGVTVEVRDRGPGMTEQPGWGVRHSIVDPIETLGGGVAVLPAPGQGTTVRFTVPLPTHPTASRLETTHRQTIEALGNLDVVAAAGVGMVLANAWLGLRYSFDDEAWPAQLGILALAVAGTLWLARWLRRRPPTPLLIGGWALAAVLAISTSLALAEPDSLLNYNSWVIGVTTISACMLASVTPPPVGVTIVAVMAAPTVAAAVWAPIPVWQPVGAYGAGVFSVVMALVVGAWQRSRLARARALQEQIAAVSREAQFRRSVSAAASGQDALIRDRLAPALAAWADDRDPPPAREAELLYAEVRDELALTGHLDEPLRARIRRARSAGLDLTLVPPDGPPTLVGACLRILDRVLDSADDLERAVIRLPDAQEPAVRLLLSPALDPARLASVTAPLAGCPTTIETTTFGADVTIETPHPARRAHRVEEIPGPVGQQ